MSLPSFDPFISPFWSSTSQSISSSLSTSCSSSSNSQFSSSYFSSHSISFQPSFSFHSPDQTSSSLKCRLFSLPLSSIQKIIIQKWFSLCTLVYNNVIRLSNEDIFSEDLVRNKYKLRSEILKSFQLVSPTKGVTPEIISNSKLRYCPFDVLGETILEAQRRVMQTWKKNKINHTNDQVKQREKTCSIAIRTTMIKKSGILPTYLGKLNTSQFIGSRHGTNLVYKNHKYYLTVPIDIEIQENSSDTFVSIDPGIRTFATCFSSNETFSLDIGKQLEKYQNKIDKLDAEISKNKKNYKKKRSLCKRKSKCYTKIENKVKDLHYQTANILCKHKNILLPVVNVKQLAKKLGEKTNRRMYALSHFKFRMRLIDKAKERGCNLILVNESYTSKTCSFCGEINETLGAKKWFKCNSCENEIDRDVNGARNILIRYLTKVSPPSDSGSVNKSQQIE